MQALKVQNQIRQNAEEISGFFSDLAKWEKDIKVKDKKIQQKKGSHAPVRGSGTVKIQSTATPLGVGGASLESIPKSGSAAQHTYDIGYSKWNNLDENQLIENVANPTDLTPAHLLKSIPEVSQAAIPRPRGVATNQDIEQYERERGNTEFNSGNFTAAIKCYTKCLGLKAQNYIAFSNRAMTYLKLQDYSRAEMDCTSALRIEPTHVKSLLRRATARNALGKHRSAILDLKTAAAIDPANKQVQQELKKSHDLLKTAVSRAPMTTITTIWADDDFSVDRANDLIGTTPSFGLESCRSPVFSLIPSLDIVAGPDLPLPGQYLPPSPDTPRPETPQTPDNHESSPMASQIKDSPPPSPATCSSPASSLASPISQLKLSLSFDRQKSSSSKGAAVKKSKKNKNTSSPATSATADSSSSICYGIERSLQLYRGNVKQLTEYLSTLSPDKLFKGSSGRMLESNVIADLLLSVTLCYGTLLSDWDRVFLWYESCSRDLPTKEFNFIILLLSNEQKEEMRTGLLSSRDRGGGGQEDEENSLRLEEIFKKYQLDC